MVLSFQSFSRRAFAPSGQSVRGVALLLYVVIAPLAAVCQQSADGLAGQVKAVNAELLSGLASQTSPARLSEILEKRADLLSRLMASEPAEAIPLVLPPAVVDRLSGLVSPDMLETEGEWTGLVVKIVADDFARHRSNTRWILQAPERIYDLAQAAPPQSRTGKLVKVRGVSRYRWRRAFLRRRGCAGGGHRG
jgi:hypothetical protein